MSLEHIQDYVISILPVVYIQEFFRLTCLWNISRNSFILLVCHWDTSGNSFISPVIVTRQGFFHLTILPLEHIWEFFHPTDLPLGQIQEFFHLTCHWDTSRKYFILPATGTHIGILSSHCSFAGTHPHTDLDRLVLHFHPHFAATAAPFGFHLWI